jgi:hypothetical protein
MSLKDRLAKYLRANHGWMPKARLCDLARIRTKATGEHTGRRLRELTEEGILEVKYVRGHAHYRLKAKVPTLF